MAADPIENQDLVAMEALAPLVKKVSQLLSSCGSVGWDSYGAEGITAPAVHATAEALAERLFPSVNGGLILEWDFTDHGPAGRSTLVVEFADDGSLTDFYASNGTQEVEWEVSDSGSSDGEADRG